jgi:hypothetical protein
MSGILGHWWMRWGWGDELGLGRRSYSDCFYLRTTTSCVPVSFPNLRTLRYTIPMPDPLPTEDQRRRLCEILYTALIDMRTCDVERAHALAYALHNLPKTMWGWGTWNVKAQRQALSYFQSKYEGGANYIAMLDEIFPP